VTERTSSAGAHPNGPLVAVRDVHKTYRRGSEDVHALRGVSFDIGRGEVIVLIGPSGSGKTTLLNVLCGWERPDQGEVSWAGRSDGPAPGAPAWADLAVVPQNLGLLDELSVRENVALPVRLGGAGSMEDVDDLLSALGLDHAAARAPWELSLGEQQRAALARALVLGPRLLLADEPTGHQDEGFGRLVLRIIRAATEVGTTCLIASHNQEALKIADRVLAMRDGIVRRSEISRQEPDDRQWSASPPR
jgi:putative ABC transport system ATP-binding protein